MAYLLRCGAVFLHVPKTSGAWVTQILRELDLIEYQLGHEHADFYRALCPHSYHATVKWVLRNFSRKLVWRGWFSRRALTKLHEIWPTPGFTGCRGNGAGPASAGSTPPATPECSASSATR